MIVDVIKFIMNMNEQQYFGTTPILESEPIDIPNAKKCRVNHGLPAYKSRLKSLQMQKRNRKETEKENRGLEKAILENYNKNELKEILEELPAKIGEVYDLELAEEMTDIYEDLTDQIHELEVKKDKYKKECKRACDAYKRTREAFEFAREEYKKLCKTLEEERIEKDSIKGSCETFTKVAMEVIDKERELHEKTKEELEEERNARTQAESEVEWLRGELEAERRLRADAEYDRELVEMQLAEHSTDNINED